MIQKPARAKTLSKVEVSLRAGRSQNLMDLIGDPVPLSFVYGIGKEGLTPFEYALAEAAPGESVAFSVPQKRLASFFEHIFFPTPAWDHEPTIHFNVRLDNVVPASGREVVKAMAEMADGCSCGCGCGGHDAPHHDPCQAQGPGYGCDGGKC